MREEECPHLVCWSRWRRWRSSSWPTLPPLLCSFFCFPLLSLLVLETPKAVATVSVTFLCLCFFLCLCVSWVSQSSALSPVRSPFFVTFLSVFVSGSRPLFPLVLVPALPPVFSCFSPLCYPPSSRSLFPLFSLSPAGFSPVYLPFFYVLCPAGFLLRFSPLFPLCFCLLPFCFPVFLPSPPHCVHGLSLAFIAREQSRFFKP